MENGKSVDSQFIQQHLANERTFLAWARTAVAVVGLGFLAAGVVFRSSEYASIGHSLAVIIGVSSVILGGLIISCATRDYFVKRKTINDSTFHAPGLSIWITFASLGVIDVFLLLLVILLLM
ncbi:YidH family protein [Paenibacillus turpanensis]|uniref:YidH family protein n=1 Tax=Paenibacillus turpanensis TaxID=2689078 RepID=UPI00140D9463|nr:DUF202 domain-containing protein [Paenibacillus turpanensis]